MEPGDGVVVEPSNALLRIKLHLRVAWRLGNDKKRKSYAQRTILSNLGPPNGAVSPPAEARARSVGERFKTRPSPPLA